MIAIFGDRHREAVSNVGRELRVYNLRASGLCLTSLAFRSLFFYLLFYKQCCFKSTPGQIQCQAINIGLHSFETNLVKFVRLIVLIIVLIWYFDIVLIWYFYNISESQVFWLDFYMPWSIKFWLIFVIYWWVKPTQNLSCTYSLQLYTGSA